MATKARKTKSEAAKRPQNPLLAPWRTPFKAPPFKAIEPKRFKPAFDLALKTHKQEIAEIAGKEQRPTFANTIVALEKSGVLLSKVADVFFNLASADTNDALQAIERDISPRLAQHQSAILLNRRLFLRIADLHERRDELGLDAESVRLLERTYKGFVRAGAKLDAKSRKRVSEINTELAKLGTAFTQNVLADEQAWHMMLDGERDLEGLPESVRAAAAQAATDLGKPGQYAITLARSSVESFLQFSARRDLREEAWKAWIKRGELGGKTDNRKIVVEMIKLRSELARLLGFETFADYVLEDTMAKTPAGVRTLLDKVWPAALRSARAERDALEKRARAGGENFKIAAWDWRYYAEKERKARYDLDEGEVRSYLALENVLEAAFDTAGKLFGIVFEERPDVPVYHPDVRAWEVKTKAGDHVGLFYGDYYARPSKRSGAWMSSYRGQHKLTGSIRPIVVNVMSVARGATGTPTLLSFDDARTLFHELGHGLHGLLSDVTYPSLAMTNVLHDFVELPSQLYEHWLSRPEVLKRFALHEKTGKPMPERLLKQLEAARTFNQGFQTVEYTASTLLDLELHSLNDASGLDVDSFESEVLARIGMPAEIVPRHRIPHFQHIIGGYAAGYYSYLWSEVMDADAFAAFTETGNIFDKKTANRLKTHIYSAGGRQDALDAYISFRGRAPEIDGLLRKRGLE
ncbi:M3 family metallopeptidase [Hyphomicrobium sp.]|uniref:M3 family metallopeptidase n=1 Tax=Hyphomicrobium sp. TaxID=82 RepID=UPI002E328409|nr:M3 family metallopeptidase [Hyphomicrobium sp.]HEX2840780.1 M3 family metallopeptidase [Hyphomicrobium sp.]